MQRLFDIVTDSCADMTEEYYETNAVERVKLGFTMQNVNYGGEDGEKITEKEFYDKLRGGALPTTYQVTCESAKTHIERLLKRGRDVLVIAFSSGLSGTCDSFRLAAKQLSAAYKNRKIYVVDSLCASMGEGLLLDYVIKKADGGATIEETRDYAERLKGNIRHLFTVNNLFHLKRGGRVSPMTAIVGSILKIKPVMRVDERGKLVATGKAMGRKKALQTLVDTALKTHDLAVGDPVFISHGDCMEDAEYVRFLIQTALPQNPVTVGYIGSVIGAHAGDGTLAVFYKGKNR
ncbi:MAG: DegV family protein [Clostridia bacterium]|nr:DegV family protein [Clostridia bacterium]